MRDEAGRDRVMEDVLQHGLEVLLRLDEAGRETLPEDVVAAAVDGVEGARVLAVQVAHSLGEVRFRCLDEQVVVVAQQAARVEPPAVPPEHAAKLMQEAAPVVVVQEAQPSVVAARRDVVPGAGGEVAARTGHTATVAPPSPFRCACDKRGTRPLRPRHVPGTSRGPQGHG
jgi:hypothetical protein